MIHFKGYFIIQRLFPQDWQSTLNNLCQVGMRLMLPSIFCLPLSVARIFRPPKNRLMGLALLVLLNVILNFRSVHKKVIKSTTQSKLDGFIKMQSDTFKDQIVRIFFSLQMWTSKLQNRRFQKRHFSIISKNNSRRKMIYQDLITTIFLFVYCFCFLLTALVWSVTIPRSKDFPTFLIFVFCCLKTFSASSWFHSFGSFLCFLWEAPFEIKI